MEEIEEMKRNEKKLKEMKTPELCPHEATQTPGFSEQRTKLQINPNKAPAEVC